MVEIRFPELGPYIVCFGPTVKRSLVELALACPDYYVQGVEHKDIKSIQVLSKALEEAGYVCLSKAVFGGYRWAVEIAEGKDLGALETEASHPNWTWNRNKENE